jgi:hypothetical protein
MARRSKKEIVMPKFSDTRRWMRLFGLTAVLCAGLMLFGSSPAQADPPRHAKAHGWRAKQARFNKSHKHTRACRDRHYTRYDRRDNDYRRRQEQERRRRERDRNYDDRYYDDRYDRNYGRSGGDLEGLADIFLGGGVGGDLGGLLGGGRSGGLGDLGGLLGGLKLRR